MTTPTTRETFRGYEAKLDGTKLVRVINAITGVNRTTGETLECYKVLPMTYQGYVGNHSLRAVYSYGEPMIVRRERVTR